MVNNISTEELINSIFSNEENDLLEITKNFSEEDLDFFNNIDCNDNLTEESMHILNDINLMNFAMKTIESVVSSEDDSTNSLTGTVKKDNVFTKFWEWLKKILNKIKNFIILNIKKIQIWIKKSFIVEKVWVIANLKKLNKAIEYYQINKQKEDITIPTLTVKLPKLDNLENDELYNKTFKNIKELTAKAIIKVIANTPDNELINEIKQSTSEFNARKINEYIYGDNTAKPISFIDFIQIFDFEKIITKDMIFFNNTIKNFNESLNQSKKLLKFAEQKIKKKNNNTKDIKELKNLASAAHKGITFMINVNYFFLSCKIHIVDVTFQFCRKIIKEYNQIEKNNKI